MWAICTHWECVKALSLCFFLLALEFGGQQGLPHPSQYCHPLRPHIMLQASIPLPWPHYSSLAPGKLLWQLIISWHKAEQQRLHPPHPATAWAHKVATFTFRAQIGPVRCHQAEMQGQQLFPVQPPPLRLPALCLTLSSCHFLTPSAFSCTPSLPRGLRWSSSFNCPTSKRLCSHADAKAFLSR